MRRRHLSVKSENFRFFVSQCSIRGSWSQILEKHSSDLQLSDLQSEKHVQKIKLERRHRNDGIVNERYFQDPPVESQIDDQLLIDTDSGNRKRRSKYLSKVNQKF